MNARRRKSLSVACRLLYDALSIIEQVGNEEEEAYENMPENLQGSSLCDRLYDNVDNLREIEEAILDYTTIMEEM